MVKVVVGDVLKKFGNKPHSHVRGKLEAGNLPKILPRLKDD